MIEEKNGQIRMQQKYKKHNLQQDEMKTKSPFSNIDLNSV